MENTKQHLEKITLPDDIIHHIMSFHYSEPLETHLLKFFFNALCRENRYLMLKELNQMTITPKSESLKYKFQYKSVIFSETKSLKSKIKIMLEPKDEQEKLWREKIEARGNQGNLRSDYFMSKSFVPSMIGPTPQLDEKLHIYFGYKQEPLSFQINKFTKMEKQLCSAILKDLMLNQFDISCLQFLIYSILISKNGFMSFEIFCSKFKEFHDLIGIPMFVNQNDYECVSNKGYYRLGKDIFSSKLINFQILQYRKFLPNLSKVLEEHVKEKGAMEIIMKNLNLPWDFLHEIDSDLFFKTFHEKFFSFEKIPKNTGEQLKAQIHFLILEKFDFSKEIPLDILSLVCENMRKLFKKNQFEMIDKLNSLDGRLENYFYNNLEMNKFNSFQEFRILIWNEREKKFQRRMAEMKSNLVRSLQKISEASGDFDYYEREEEYELEEEEYELDEEEINEDFSETEEEEINEENE
jgi:hypothetical protein